MRLKIYQITSERDKDRVKFQGLEDIKRLQDADSVDPSLYDEVLDAEVDEMTLEGVFQRFNTEGHPLFRGHSLSVSDVIVIDNADESIEDGAYFCDSIGFKRIDFDEALTNKPDNLMRIVYVEPHRAPYVSEIEHSLKSEQRAVKGLIEVIDNGDGTCIVSNDEAKLIGMDGNRRIWDGSVIIAGPFFVCGDAGEEFRGLTDEEVTRYMDRFAEVENISPEEVEADTGFIIYPIN